ncbi:MAG: hypothetical protein KC931_05315 [Candidatus Omnitrophica bacterium]|nr:hypothetical protein [Candidatus Omnitrophota bacterium]MCA9416359.1 hypothetical protein [Candidatus Omnitrophota bacterium]MCA9424730.1 hypothetical protein [Candidatus Omnitrophota bacterium]MCA9434254.1 hypothetical protein [Candidatus Omnitrophota bacterium]MCA9439524.1 hypothetical protein [Candidatus Omnitrophota bacterium]
MTLEGYIGPPPHHLAQEFVKGWSAFRERMEDGINAPNLDDTTENNFLNLKIQLLGRSRIIDTVTEGDWGLHGKIKGLLNLCQSLDFIRQESAIMHDSIRNQWHDLFIQVSKSISVFHEKAEAEDNLG